MVIRVLDLCGPYCVDPADGGRLCAAVSAALEAGGAACLDFGGVSVLTSSFLNPALGCLYGTFKELPVTAGLTFLGLDAVDQALVEEVKANAVRFYAASHDQQEALIEAAAHPVENR